MIEERLESLIEMRSLELKTLQIKDDIPLYVTLDSLSTWDKNENRYKFVTRNADSCVYTPVYMLKLYPSSSKEKIVTLLEYFFKVCDAGASPQCTWKTDDCDYISLLLHIRDTIRLNLILYVIKYWSNSRNCLCQKIVLKNFQTMERRRIILLQSKLHILRLGQQSI